MKSHLPTHPAAVLALAFLATIGVGTALLMLPWASASGQSAPWLTALFTATSAVCVTGLVVVDTGTYWSPLGQGLVMALFQLGGFGMMTSATLMGLLIGGHLKLRTRLLLQSETHALSLGDVRSVARMVLVVTVLVEGLVALWLAVRFAQKMDIGWGEALWLGAFHSVSAYNNAGFSTWPDSVMRHVTDAWVLGPLMLAIVVGGLGFPVITELWANRRKRHARWSIHTTLTVWGSAALVVLGTLALWAVEHDNPKTLGPLGVADQWLAALFTSVAARTAGFNAVDIGALELESLVLHYVLMFIGGGSAGTAGGVKVTTVFSVAADRLERDPRPGRRGTARAAHRHPRCSARRCRSWCSAVRRCRWGCCSSFRWRAVSRWTNCCLKWCRPSPRWVCPPVSRPNCPPVRRA
jgi:trk system potassium uptake protein TrkH